LQIDRATFNVSTNNNNNNNNKRICTAQVCQMTSEALGGQLQSCYTARASIGYLEDSFTGQKTQPTVSKYRRKRRYKSKPRKKQATQNTAIQ